MKENPNFVTLQRRACVIHKDWSGSFENEALEKHLKFPRKIGRYKSRTGSTRTASPGRINSDRLGPDQLGSNKKTK